MTPVVHMVTPDRTMRMSIRLEDRGAIIDLEGVALIPCWCAETHRMDITATLCLGPEAKHRDQEDLEGALRGDDAAAQALAWRLIHLLFFNEPHPN